MRRAAGAAVLVAAGLAVLGCGTPAPDAPAVAARRGSFENVLSVRGRLRAAETLLLATEAGGKLSFMVPEGAIVAAGEPVFGLETEQIEKQLLDARLDLAAAEAALEKAREEARLARLQDDLSQREKEAQLAFNELQAQLAVEELEKKRRQVEAAILPRAEIAAAELSVEQAELSVASSRIDIERLREEMASKRQTSALDLQAAEARVAKTRSQVEENETYLAAAVVKAPRAGIVVHSRNWRNEAFRVGEEVWRNTPVMELPDVSRMDVVAEVNEVDIAQVASGMPARIRVEAYPDLALTGRVAEIAALARETKDVEGRDTGVRVFDVTIRLATQDERLRPGMTASVDIVLDRRDDVVLVPVAAVSRDGEALVVTLPSGRKVPVVVATSSADEAVIESGVAAGDLVLLVPEPPEAPAESAEPPPAVEAPEMPAGEAPPGAGAGPARPGRDAEDRGAGALGRPGPGWRPEGGAARPRRPEGGGAIPPRGSRPVGSERP